MNKNEYIVELTKLLDPNADEFYTNAIIDAIRLAHKLNDYVPPTAGEMIREIDKRDQTLQAIQRFFRTEINLLDQRVIATHINNSEYLAAVKAYKAATGATFGLKECKQDVDRVRAEIGSMSMSDYEMTWEKKS